MPSLHEPFMEWASDQTSKTMSPYEEGIQAAKTGASNPYGKRWYSEREDRMQQEVDKRRWEAGYNGF